MITRGELRKSRSRKQKSREQMNVGVSERPRQLEFQFIDAEEGNILGSNVEIGCDQTFTFIRLSNKLAWKLE